MFRLKTAKSLQKLNCMISVLHLVKKGDNLKFPHVLFHAFISCQHYHHHLLHQ